MASCGFLNFLASIGVSIWGKYCLKCIATCCIVLVFFRDLITNDQIFDYLITSDQIFDYLITSDQIFDY